MKTDKTMSIRDFLTEREIEQIKNQVVARLVGEQFLNVKFVVEHGEEFTDISLKPAIDSVIREETRKILEEYIHQVADEVVRPQIADAAKRLADRIVKQVDEMTNKVNWYFSIK